MKQKTNQTEQMFDTFTEMMIEQIEQIQGDWRKPWITSGTLGLPKNLKGRIYNGTNEIFLWMHCERQGYVFPIFATFNNIQALNEGKRTAKENFVHVLKGEKSFPVFYYVQMITHRETGRKITLDEYKAKDEDERKEYKCFPSMKVYNVFNIAQTNMKEARPDLWEKLTSEYNAPTYSNEYREYEPLRNLIANNAWICPITEREQNQAFYSITDNTITVPLYKQFKDCESFCNTCFHEMAHSTGHKDCNDRFNPDKGWGMDGSYAREELIAELSSALTMAQLGMTAHLNEDSARYLKAWLRELRESPDFLKKLLPEVRKANRVLREKLGTASGEEAVSEAA